MSTTATATVHVLKGTSSRLRTIEGERLLDLAASIEIGEILTYARAKEAVGVDMQSQSGRQVWQRVQQSLARDRGVHFANIPKVGYQRLDDDGKVDKSGRFIGQARRRVRAAAQVVATTDRSKLSPEKQATHDVQATVISIMSIAGRRGLAVTKSRASSTEDTERLLENIRALG